MKKLFLFLCIFAVALAVKSQETEDYQHRYLGIGIRASIFQMSDMPLEVMPPNRLIVNVDPLKYARAEVHCGYYLHSTEAAWWNGSSFTLKQSSALFGFGLFGTYPCGKAKFIAGLRYTMTNYKDDDIMVDAFGTPYVGTMKGKLTAIAPAIGGEYYFAKWFSIGAEFSFIVLTDELTPADPTDPVQNSSTSITESSLLFRFYPF